jgi:hypothetical protein
MYVSDTVLNVVYEETLILLIERMSVHPLFDPECDCMMHYCQCEHQGWIQAVAYIEDCLTGAK